MTINFKKLVTREDWESALSSIIEAARKAVAAKDDDGISEATTLLNTFVDKSPPEKAWSTDLDDLAREALAQLLLDLAIATIEDIASRTQELRRIAKAVNAMAAENEQAAADIRHEKVTQALVSALNAAKAAKAAKELQAAVKDNAGDEKIAAAAQALLDSIAKFNDTLAGSESDN